MWLVIVLLPHCINIAATNQVQLILIIVLLACSYSVYFHLLQLDAVKQSIRFELEALQMSPLPDALITEHVFAVSQSNTLIGLIPLS